jgi:hypothetical protein
MRGIFEVTPEGQPTSRCDAGAGQAARRAGGGRVASVQIAVRGRGTVPAYNVVGLLPGAGTKDAPELAQQVVVFSAHYDHLGTLAPPATPEAPAAALEDHATPPVAPAEPPDLIFNGADDDASGCAAVLELARVFGAEARAGRPSARTLIFLLVTGEERGLLSTEYWLDHPARPLQDIVLNLNFEMIGRPDTLAGGPGRLAVWLLGAATRPARCRGPPVAPTRSDQHSSSAATTTPSWSAASWADLSSTTCTRSTTPSRRSHADFTHMEGAVRASLAAARMAADGSLAPAWVKAAGQLARTGEAGD